MNAEQEHCTGLVRAADRGRYLSALLAPRTVRGGLMALYALDSELAGIRARITEPLAGEIRLQWWRDTIGALYLDDPDDPDEGGVHPVLNALKPAIAAGKLPLSAFETMTEARILDLYDDPIASMNELEGYFGETFGATTQLASLILARGEDVGSGTAAGHAGVATGLVWVLRALPRHAARGKLYLPADLLGRHGVSADKIVNGRTSPGLAAALGELRAKAHAHLADAVAAVAALPRAVLPAFATCALVPPYLRESERNADPLRQPIEINPLSRQWRIWRAVRRGL